MSPPNIAKEVQLVVLKFPKTAEQESPAGAGPTWSMHNLRIRPSFVHRHHVRLLL
jgi:hypothetical protein